VKSIIERYTELVSEVKDVVYRMALSLVGEQTEAEDITQDIYERVWRARDKVLLEEHPRAYVCRMTLNLAIDRHRQRERQATTISPEIERGGIGDGSDLRDIGERTKAIIATLPEKQRLTIHLRDIEGYEIEEIAEIMEMDATSVRMNLSRARKSVREQLLRVMNYGVE
jgi:RNA polymerase sigma-70 factor (ECF subfamily)